MATMKALYIGEGSEDFDYLARLFHAHFPKVPLINANNSKVATELLTCDGPFGIIIIDAVLRAESPEEIVEKIIDLTGNRPAIFVGPKTFIETRVSEELYRKHEANQILYRPFEVKDFKKVVDAVLTWAQQEEFEQSIIEIDYKDYLPIKIKNFYFYNEMPYDAYLEVTHAKFVKIISKCKWYPHSKITALVTKGVKSLYLRQEDNLRFLNASSERLVSSLNDISADKTKLGPMEIFHTQIEAVSILHQFLRSVGVGAPVITLATSVIHSICSVFDSMKNWEKIGSKFPLEGKGTAECGVLTCYLALGLLKSIKWDSKMSRDKLGLASIIQDSTITNDKMMQIQTLKDPIFSEFTEDEQREYRHHPQKAADISNSFSGFSDVSFIIEQHHEHPEGIGFPFKLNSFDITPMSAAFILANRIGCEWVRTTDKKLRTLHMATDRLHKEFNSGNFKDVIKAISKL